MSEIVWDKSVLKELAQRGRLINEDLPKPDMCIHHHEIHPDIRRDLGFLYPFKPYDDPKWQGCYLFWAELISMPTNVDLFSNDYLSKVTNDIIPLYAGHAGKLQLRVYQHCKETLSYWINEYIHSEWSISGDNELLQIDYPYIYIWLTDNKEDRISLEHLILSYLKPYFNRQ